MSGMNPFLAEMFNTNGYAEKVAQVRENVEMLLKVAEEENIDLSELNEDEVVELANSLASQAEAAPVSDAPQGAVEEYDPNYVEGPENMGPKTAEVDFLGRYMAHAYNDELQKIAALNQPEQEDEELDKEAAGKWEAAKKSMGKAWGRYKELLGSSKKSGTMKGLKEEVKSQRGLYGAPETGKVTYGAGGVGKKGQEAITSAERAVTKEKAKSIGTKALTGLAGAGVVGGAGAAAYKAGKSAKEKKSHLELLDDAAIQRANEFIELANNGLNVTFDKVASVDEDDMNRVVTELAWHKLIEAGYIQE